MKKRIVITLFFAVLLAFSLFASVKALDPYKVDWNIQIDSANTTKCAITYDNTKYTIDLRYDKILSKGAGTCLALSTDKYWLKVAKTKECVDKFYNISCDQDFLVSLLYLDKLIYNVPIETYPSTLNESVIVNIIGLTPPSVPTNECQDIGYSCRDVSICPDDEEKVDYSCIAGICCKPISAEEDCNVLSDCGKRGCDKEWITVEGVLKKCEYQTELTCDDMFDNDNDGDIDLSDSDCRKTCLDRLGKECEKDEECSISTVKTIDVDSCCLGECEAAEKTCAEQNGVECESDQNCKNDAWLTASDTSYCCETECSSKANLVPFIIILAVLGLGALGYFIYKKGFFRKKPAPPRITPSTTSAFYQPPVRPLAQQPQIQQQPVNVHIKLQPKYIPQPQRREAVKREVKSELDETLKKLKKLAEEKK